MKANHLWMSHPCTPLSDTAGCLTNRCIGRELDFRDLSESLNTVAGDPTGSRVDTMRTAPRECSRISSDLAIAAAPYGIPFRIRLHHRPTQCGKVPASQRARRREGGHCHAQAPN